MENYLDVYIVEKHVPAEVEREVRALDEPSKLAIIDFITICGPSANAFQNILSTLTEISVRDKKLIGDILVDDDLQRILSSDKGSRKEKLSLFRKRLELLRFPEKNKIQETVSALVSQIRKQYSVKLEMPEELEGDTIEVQFSIRSSKDLSDKIKMLKDLESSHKVENLFDVLMGRV